MRSRYSMIAALAAVALMISLYPAPAVAQVDQSTHVSIGHDVAAEVSHFLTFPSGLDPERPHRRAGRQQHQPRLRRRRLPDRRRGVRPREPGRRGRCAHARDVQVGRLRPRLRTTDPREYEAERETPPGRGSSRRLRRAPSCASRRTTSGSGTSHGTTTQATPSRALSRNTTCSSAGRASCGSASASRSSLRMGETSNVAIAAERYAREDVIPNKAQDAEYRPTTYERRLIARISVAFASGAAWAS